MINNGVNKDSFNNGDESNDSNQSMVLFVIQWNFYPSLREEAEGNMGDNLKYLRKMYSNQHKGSENEKQKFFWKDRRRNKTIGFEEEFSM